MPNENTVRSALTPARRKRAKRHVETSKFDAFTRRILAAYARRVAERDVEALRTLVALRLELDTVVRAAVTGLRDAGFSWAEIGLRLGITRQSAQERYGRPAERETLDRRLLADGMNVSITTLVAVFADHHPGFPADDCCPYCGYRYPQGATDCPTNATVRPLLYRRRLEDQKALQRLTGEQRADLCNQTNLNRNRAAAARAARTSVATEPAPVPALFGITTGGAP